MQTLNAQPSIPSPVVGKWSDRLICCPLFSIASPKLVPNMAFGNWPVGTIRGSPTATRIITPKGVAYQLHPGGAANGATNVDFKSPIDLNTGDHSVVWIGYADNVTTANGQLVQRGDIVGGSDSIRLKFETGTVLKLSYIDSSPAQFDLTITDASIVTGSFQAVGYTKRGNVRTLYTTAGGTKRLTATQTSGLSSMRAGTFGFSLAGDTGHNHPLFFGAWAKVWTEVEMWEVLTNPWQVYPGAQQHRWMVVVVGTGQVGYPIADVATNSWTNESGGLPLYPSLADGGTGTANDATYAQSPANPTTEYMEELLTTLLTPVAGSQTLEYHLRAQGQQTHFAFDLRQGAVSLETWSHDVAVGAAWTPFTHTISATITDYADARVRITCSS
jgi:hypothetical protein